MKRDLATIGARLLHEAHDLKADHRKHAGHQIENESAKKHSAENGEK